MSTPNISEAARRAAEQEIDEFHYRHRITQPRRPFEAGHYVQSTLDSAHPAPKEGATPETDAVSRAIGSLACQWRGGSIDAVQFEQAAQTEMNRLGQLELRLAEAKREVEAAWKEAKKWQDMGQYFDEQHDKNTQENIILRSQLQKANELLGSENDRWVFLESLLVSIPVKFQAGRPPQYVNLSRKDIDGYRTNLNQQSK